jgi:hypothetical protein
MDTTRPRRRSATKSASPATSTSPQPIRTLDEIKADIRALEAETDNLIAEIAGEG